MNSKSFDYQRIAQGYAMDRPFLHKQVMELLRKDLPGEGNFQNGLDIGCGAGLSTKALKLLCDKVTGVDISGEMIIAARTLYQEPAYTFFQSSAEEIKAPPHSFDIVTAAGVVNWVDEKSFLTNLWPIMTKEGILVVYDFWITDRMKGNEAYTGWWHDRYLKEFPKPPRKEIIWTQEMVGPCGFIMDKQAAYTLEYGFDKEAFIKFMMTQSNVNAQIDEGGKTAGEAACWFEDTLGEVFSKEKETLIFEGWYWKLIKNGELL